MPRTDENGRPYERSYFRIRCTLPIRARRVAPEGVEALAAEILQRRTGPAGSNLDPDVAAWLDRIEQKLDRILVTIGAVTEPARPSQPEQVVLSGGGLRFASGEARSMGDTLLIELELPGSPTRLVRCLGNVVGVYGDEDGGREVAITYHAIHPSDREAIVQHTLAVERGEQRARIDEDRVAS